ncbi:MAG: hypothetical protein HY913_18775 [Desulfomonile tiedjei]|nr:hypothetical protein [Desulfomonile tiedjei]
MDRVEYEKLIIQDLINLHKSGDLELNPWYQRRSAEGSSPLLAHVAPPFNAASLR